MPARLRIESEVGWQHDSYSSLKVATSGWVTIAPDVPRPLAWALEQFNRFSAWLALVAGGPMAPDCIQARRVANDAPVSVIVALQNRHICQHRSPHEYFLALPAIQADIEGLLNRWFESYAKVGLPCQLALSAAQPTGAWSHVQFVSMLQALEGLHRGWYGGTYLSEDDYVSVNQSLASAIPKSIPDPLRAALLSRIRYGNQYSLRKRLDELARVLPEGIRRIVLGEEGCFPGHWVETRNYYTHWDEALRPEILDNEGMFHAAVRMREAFRLLLLAILAVPVETLERALNGSCEVVNQLHQLNAITRRRKNPQDMSGVLMVVTREDSTRASEEP